MGPWCPRGPAIGRYHIPMPTQPPRYVIATWQVGENIPDTLNGYRRVVDAIPEEIVSTESGLTDLHGLVHVKVVRGRPAPDHSRQTVLYSREDVPSHYAPELRPTNTGEPVGVQGERERGTVYP